MKAHIVGGSGYTGGEVIRHIIGHPKIDDYEATSRQYLNQPVSNAHPNLINHTEKKFGEYKGSTDADIVFLALPHGLSMEYMVDLIASGIKVIDLSADFRINDMKLYEKHYKKHCCPELLGKAVYGLPEVYRNEIKSAQLVANPGCYVTAALLAIKPLLKFKKSLDLEKIIVDSKSGASGAGVKPSHFLHSPEVCGNPKTYKSVGHRHEPEINHILNRYEKCCIGFSPTLMPTVRGITSSTHVFGNVSKDELSETFKKTYVDEPFVRIVDNANVSIVNGTNYCDISVHSDGIRVVVNSVLDNLIKGAGGQAIQNMNLMMGFKETDGLNHIPYHP